MGKSKEEKKKLDKKERREKKVSSESEEAPAPKATKETSDEAKTETETKNRRSEWSVWIGNLPYTITKDELTEFFKPCDGEVTRINLPRKSGKSRGFAYVDFDGPSSVSQALGLSEKYLGGRAVLIKDASDFNKTGMPSRVMSTDAADGEVKKPSKDWRSRNPPSPTLFIGNLSFDTQKSDLKELFRPFGELVGVRVATFEDNPEKCKGFAYIDFKYTADATTAIKSPEVRSIGGRKARVEYAGEDATRKGRPWESDPDAKFSYQPPKADKRGAPNAGGVVYEKPAKKSRKLETENMAETKLQGLPVEFEGQKITFGD
ncbi:Nucleolar protein 13 [Coemansia sp. RSA 552]|nr:Nucleolar protein 13 [Coemansia sp. RSA 552]